MEGPICGKTKADLKRTGHTEKGTQAYILQRLEMLERQGKCYFFRNNSFSGRLTRWNGSQGVIKNNKAGTPDIICCFPYPTGSGTVGQFVGIEVKGPSGRLEDSQILGHKALEAAGGIVWVVYCPEDFEIYLKSL